MTAHADQGKEPGTKAGPFSFHVGKAKWGSYYTGLPAIVDRSHFFDFERTKTVFEKAKTIQDLDNTVDEKFFNEYEAWSKKFNGKPISEALIALEAMPNKNKIKEAHDMQWAYNAWSEMVYDKFATKDTDAFPGVNQFRFWQGWNKWSDWFCKRIKKRNIFNDSCKVPDWRTKTQKLFAFNQRGSTYVDARREIEAFESLLADKTLDAKSRDIIEQTVTDLKSSLPKEEKSTWFGF